MTKRRDQPAKTIAAPSTGDGDSVSEPSATGERIAGSAFEGLLAVATDAIIVTGDDGRIQTFSPAAERLFGYPASEVLGEDVRMLMPEPFRSEHDGHPHRYWGSSPPKTIGTGREVKALKRDGTVFPIDLSVGQARIAGNGGFVAVVRDLTARQRAQTEFDEIQRTLSSFMENYPGMAYRCENDAAWSGLFVSRGSLALTGYAPHAFVAGDIRYADLIHPQDRAGVRQAVDLALASHQSYDLTYRIRTRSGEERWVFERTFGVYSPDGDRVRYIEGFIEDVTERVEALERLRASEARLRKIIDLVPQMIFVKDATGVFLLLNRAVAEAFGTTVEELTGHSHPLARVPPEDEDRVAAQDREVLESGKPVTLSGLRFTDASGRNRILQTTKIPFREESTGEQALLAVAVDITEQKEAAEHLREKDELIRVAFDHAPIAVVTSDLEGTVLSANRATSRILGYSQEELSTMNVTDFAGRELSSQIRDKLRQVRDGEIDGYSEDRQYIRKDGSTARGRTHASAVLDAAGRPVLLVTQFEDLTKRRRAEREAERLRENLAHVDRLDAMGQMATGLAHEINQPLTAISSYAQTCRFLLEQGSLEPPQFLEILDKISRNAKRAGEVIRQLRSLVSRRESRREKAQINELVTDVAALMEVEARLAHLRIEMRLEEPVPPVIADKVQIQQVVLNLIRNGLDAMRDVEAAERRLLIGTAVRGEDEVEITVEDRGVGVPEGLDEELFHPFFTTKRTGMGIGLSICQSIVEAHGGRLWFARNRGRGTTFHFTLATAIETPGDRPGRS